MPLHLALAATLGFLTFLSTLMLGLGQSDSFLPILIGTAAVASFILTDYRRVVQLGDWTVNGFAVLIVCFNIADVLHHRGEDMAWAIARVLVFIQVVLLFREKETRFCWQIMMISMLQVVVATVFQQSIMFGALLLLYVFVGLCVFILLFLQQEHRYFRRHSFVRTLSEAIRSEMTERQDRRRLARIALMTLFMGPLSLVLSFGKRKATDQQTQTHKQLRSLFLIFPTKEDLAQKARWESIDDPLADEVATQAESAASFHAVSRRVGKVDSSFTFSRFPLLTERPSFSAGTQNPRPWNGRWRELFLHLAIGTSIAFVVAVILFCLVPRIGRIEFNQFTLKPGFERWMRPVRQNISVGAVGISEEIQLGSLGTVIPYHREVMKVRFFHHPDNKLVLDTDQSSHLYREIVGATLYFRGTPLDTYSAGSWALSPIPSPNDIISPPLQYDEHGPGGYSLEGYLELFRSLQFAILPTSEFLQMGATLRMQDLPHLFFEEGADLVTLAMEIKPLDTLVFFAPHPFFCANKLNEVGLQSKLGRVEEIQPRPRRRDARKTIVCTGFKRGVQLDLTPCQEWINRDNLLQFPEKGLESLKALATKWDAESRLPKSNIVGRARFMEQRFLQSQEFLYQLGGIIRDYDLDPLEDFIAHNPKGHCEYFAGALALMLRSVGIGSRVILGFKTDVRDFHASTIRQSDAHAWVEVYVPPEAMPQRMTGQYAQWWTGGGWLRLDPTPAPHDLMMARAFSLQWTDFYYRVQAFWNDFVVNMNQGRQLEWIYQPLYQVWHYVVYRAFNFEFWKNLFVDMVRYYVSFFTDTPRPKQQTWDMFYLFPPLIVLGMIFLVGRQLVSWLRILFRKQTGEEMRRRITIEFYLRMEKMLAKIGVVRSLALTPLEFARQSPAPFAMFAIPVVEAFYRVRFGHVVLTDEESKSVLNMLDQLEHSIKEFVEEKLGT